MRDVRMLNEKSSTVKNINNNLTGQKDRKGGTL